MLQHSSNGWKLYGKTGNGTQLSDDKTITFVYLIADDDNDKPEIYASLRAKTALKLELQKIILYYY